MISVWLGLLCIPDWKVLLLAVAMNKSKADGLVIVNVQIHMLQRLNCLWTRTWKGGFQPFIQIAEWKTLLAQDSKDQTPMWLPDLAHVFQGKRLSLLLNEMMGFSLPAVCNYRIEAHIGGPTRKAQIEPKTRPYLHQGQIHIYFRMKVWNLNEVKVSIPPSSWTDPKILQCIGFWIELQRVGQRPGLAFIGHKPAFLAMHWVPKGDFKQNSKPNHAFKIGSFTNPAMLRDSKTVSMGTPRLESQQGPKVQNGFISDVFSNSATFRNRGAPMGGPSFEPQRYLKPKLPSARTFWQILRCARQD